MKANRLKTFALFSLGIIGLTACGNDDESQDLIETMDARVSAYTCFYKVALEEGISEGISVKFGTNPEFESMGFSSIDGFTYERGSEYSLRIQRTTLANPLADAGSYSYKLVNVVSNKKADATRTETKLYVSAESGEFKLGEITQDIPVAGMKIREDDTNEWTTGPFNRISGFEYVEGYDYVLSVEKIVLPDNSDYYYLQPVQYVLLDIISKDKPVD